MTAQSLTNYCACTARRGKDVVRGARSPTKEKNTKHSLELLSQSKELKQNFTHIHLALDSFVFLFFLFGRGRGGRKGGAAGSPQIVSSIDLLVFSHELQFCPFLQRIRHSSFLKLVLGISQNSSPLSESVLMNPFLWKLVFIRRKFQHPTMTSLRRTTEAVLWIRNRFVGGASPLGGTLFDSVLSVSSAELEVASLSPVFTSLSTSEALVPCSFCRHS